MEVYDNVHKLATSIKNSKEYIEYKEIKEKMKEYPEIKAQIDEFEKIRYEEQLLGLQGEQQSPEKMAKLQELYKILVDNPDVKEYFEKEVKFNVMIADVNKIIGEAIQDVL